MKSEVKTKWLEALRSGEYEQGKNNLCRDGKYCCLGVLTDLYVKEQGIQWEPGVEGKKAVGKEDTLLPQVVMDWAGLSSGNPSITTANGEVFHLAAINDGRITRAHTFSEIADLIEVHL